MSGGVDSSVAALLLKEAGYRVIGVTMQIWQSEEQACMEDNGGCCGLSAVEDARTVADCLDIPYYVMNFKEEFRRDVMDYFVREYQHGRTPNPCIACNRHLKWEALLSRARSIGADKIATGHYARVEHLENGRFAIRNSLSARKDQTYVLYSLTQEQLSRTLMPVGGYDKDEIRRIAARAALPVAEKKDSQDICFIPDGDCGAFLDRELGDAAPSEGDFVLSDGTKVGRHRGVTHYTIGQRKGLGLAFGEPYYVSRIDPAANEVTVGPDREVYSDHLVMDRLCFMAEETFDPTREYTAKIRYSHAGTKCHVSMLPDGRARIAFCEPVRAVTPGQAAVVYDGEYIAGGGTIEADNR